MDSFACAASISLQHGVPLKLLCEKFAHTRFEPSGWSHQPEIGYAKSIMDYIFRWLELRFLTGQQQVLFDNMRPKYPGDAQPTKALGEAPYTGDAPPNGPTSNGYDYPGGAATRHQHASDAMKDLIDMGDAPSCHVCGAIMTRNGSCYRCMSCGSTSGCS